MDKELREKIIERLHWTDYFFIGQNNDVYGGSLTQKSEEAIADQLLDIIEEAVREETDASYTKGCDVTTKALKRLYCKWCPEEQQCDEDLTEEEKMDCLACGGFVDELLSLIEKAVKEEQEGICQELEGHTWLRIMRLKPSGR